MIVPAVGRYLWDWFFEASDNLTRTFDGACRRIPWTEWRAWADLTGHVVYQAEYATLRAMDSAYCAEMNKELADYRVRQQEAAKIAGKGR